MLLGKLEANYVLSFLKNNPLFLKEHGLSLVHESEHQAPMNHQTPTSEPPSLTKDSLLKPDSPSKIISFSDKRYQKMTQKYRHLALNMNVFIARAARNDRLLHALHQLSLFCASAQEKRMLLSGLGAIFDTYFKLHNYQLVQFKQGEETGDFYDAVRHMAQPICGFYAPDSVIALFPEALQAQSFAQIPLHYGDHCLGLLVFAHADTYYFDKKAGVDYLAKMGELLAAALYRFQAAQ